MLADDNPRLRSELRAALQIGGCDVCAEAASAAEAVRLTVEHLPDIVLLDIYMPGNGIHAALQISRAAPSVVVVMLTQSQEDDHLFDSLRAGASGYLIKGTDPERLPGLLRGVLAGEAAMPPHLVARILEEFRAPASRRLVHRPPVADRLSAREWEVMEMLGQGRTTEDVAASLFISPVTVRVHVSAVLRKLRVKSRRSALDLLREP